MVYWYMFGKELLSPIKKTDKKVLFGQRSWISDI